MVMGTATLKAKPDQQVAGICHETLFHFFLIMNKAYALLYRTHFMEVLQGYGLGAKLQQLLQRYWDVQTLVPWAVRYYDRQFKTEQEVTQGDPVSPYHLQHSGRCISAGNIGGGLHPPGRPPCIGMGSWGAQNFVFYANYGQITGGVLIGFAGDSDDTRTYF